MNDSHQLIKKSVCHYPAFLTPFLLTMSLSEHLRSNDVSFQRSLAPASGGGMSYEQTQARFPRPQVERRGGLRRRGLGAAGHRVCPAGPPADPPRWSLGAPGGVCGVGSYRQAG